MVQSEFVDVFHAGTVVPISKVLFVDGRVPNLEAVIAAAEPGVKVVVLDPHQDGVQQMARALSGMSGLESIGVVSHGNEGVLLLGEGPLFCGNLDAYQAQLQVIGSALAPNGDILLYGCDVGAGEQGAQFLAGLAELTGADVAASADSTGTAGRGGDWTLEITHGTVETHPVLDAQALADYGFLLHTASVSSVAELKAAIAIGNTDGVADFITVTGNITFASAADAITINVSDGQTLSIVGGGFTLSGANLARVLDITAGSVAIDNLTITNGFLTGAGGNTPGIGAGLAGGDALGAGIRNAGTLVITDSTITANKAAGGGGGGAGIFGGAGAGGGAGGFDTTHGGVGGTNPPRSPGPTSPGVGGTGAGFSAMGGGGGSTVGGIGGIHAGYTAGGNGGTANSGTISIGGGGGGAGTAYAGGNGGNAVGGIFNSGTLTINGSSITNNIGAGGGGGGGGAAGNGTGNGGSGGSGIGAIWNAGGTVHMDSATNTSLSTGNAGGAGIGGVATTTGYSSGANGTAGSSFTTNGGTTTVGSIEPTATLEMSDTALRAGETATLTITFSEAVTGFDNADLTIANGSLSPVSSSDGGITWSATFTPAADVTDTSNIITLNNTGVSDLVGNAGVGTTDSNNYAIDTVRPTATVVVADTALAAGETTSVTITFSEAVTGFSNADLTIANGTVSGLSSGDGGITWTATLTPTAGVTDTSNIITLNNTGVSDAAGNAGSGTSDSNNYAIDTMRPTATLVVADTALSAGETTGVTITFGEAVTGFTNADLAVANGTLSAVSSSDGGVTWTATFTPTASITDTSNVITLDNTGVSDLVGNAGTGTTDSNNYAIDTLRPTATLAMSDTALQAGETATLTITFSEAVAGFTNADLTVANGTVSAVSSIDGGITWTATFTPTAGITDASNVITLDNTGLSDLVGNAGTGTTDSNNYAISTTRATSSLVLSDTALRAGETATLTITFSEAVTGFDNADLTIAHGTLSAVSSSDGGITWTAIFTPTAGITNASNVITLDNTGIVNAAGNAGTGTTDSNNYAIDTQRPTATLVMADTALAADETSGVTITFSEAVTGFTNADLTVANGSLSAVSSSDGGITWTGIFTPTAGITDASNVITLDNSGVSDLAGNAGTGTTDSNNYAISTTRATATATLALSDAALRAGETATLTITFSEAVIGFTNADLTVANGSLSAVSSSDGGITWTGIFTPTAGITDASNVITLDNSGVQDGAGNAGEGTTQSNNYAIDTAPPVVTDAHISIAGASGRDGQYRVGDTVTATWNNSAIGDNNTDILAVTIDFSEFGGTTVAATLSGGSGIWSATYTITAGTLSASGRNISVTAADLAGNSVTTADSSNAAVDNVSPPDADGDGVSDAVENAAPGLPLANGSGGLPGDGNGDGVLDSLQAGVSSASFLQTPGPAPARYITLVADSAAGKIDSVDGNSAMLQDVRQLDSPLQIPTGMTLPLGLISFGSNVGTPGITETFSLYVEATLGVNGYWSQDSAGAWVNLASEAYGGGMSMEGGKLRLDFKLVDGGQFDADGQADGMINSVGAIASMALSLVGTAPDVPASGFWF